MSSVSHNDAVTTFLCRALILILHSLSAAAEPDSLAPYFDYGNELNLMDRELGFSVNLPHVAASNGDVRLASNYPYEIITNEGRLEVYSQALYTGSGFVSEGMWGTVCGDKFSMKEAHVACRQMGYAGARNWDYAINTE